MLRLPSLSIRTVLALLIGVIGLLLVGQSTSGALVSYRRRQEASLIMALSQANAPLFSTVTGERTSRNVVGDWLKGDAPIDEVAFGKVLENRRRGKADVSETLRRLSQIDAPDIPAASQFLQSADDNYILLTPAIDASLHVPRVARDPAIIRQQADALARLSLAVIATNDFLETAMQMVDPLVDQLIALRQAARALRGAAGAVVSRVRTAKAVGRPFTLTDLDEIDAERVRIDVAWGTMRASMARDDTPPALKRTIADADHAYSDFIAGPLANWLGTLRVGHVLVVPAPEFEAASAAVLAPMVAIADTAMSELVARATAVGQAASRALMLNAAALLAAVCFISIGGVFAQKRISGPIRSLTDAMVGLANGMPLALLAALKRSDEIGEMAAALHLFRDEMMRAASLAELTAAQQVAEAAQRESLAKEIAAMSEAQGEVVETMAFGLMQLAEGDLSFSLSLPLAPEYEMLRTTFNAGVEGLQNTVQHVLQCSRAIGAGTQDIAHAAEDLAQRTEQQAARLRQVAAAVAAITASVQQTATASARANELAAATQTETERSNAVLQQTVQTMGEIDQSAQQIGQAIGLIDDIAFQTNLLALNAGVEAARSGEAGRGFAVVASEVRALAQRVTGAATEIKSLVETSKQQVASGVQLVDETSAALQRIQTDTVSINSAIRAIAVAAAEQSTGLGEVNVTVTQIDQLTQQNVTMIANSSAATQALTDETQALLQAMARFKTAAPACLSVAA